MTIRKNFGAKPISHPQPVFIIATYNEDGTANGQCIFSRYKAEIKGAGL